MITINTIALLLCVIICLVVAPFMTIGTFFILSSYVILKCVGFLFFVLGFIHMIYRLDKMR
jgi:hypothetical protein